MRSLEFWILAYLLNSLWQVPLLFAAGYLAARALRSVGAATEHSVWVIILLLQSLLPACAIFPWGWLRTLSFWSWRASEAGDAHVTVVTGAGSGAGVLQLPGVLLITVAMLYAAVSAYFVARFLWRGATVSAMRRSPGRASYRGSCAFLGAMLKQV